jgi:hypothetical protein
MIVMIAVIVVVMRLLALSLAFPAVGRAPLLLGMPLLLGAALGLAMFFEAALAGAVLGLSALGFVPFGFTPLLVTPLIGATLGVAPFFDALVPSVTGVVSYIGGTRADPIFAQLGRLFSKDHPVTIRPIIPPPIHEIRGAAVIMSVRVIFDAGRRLHVLDGIAVDHLAARMRHAAGQRGEEQDPETYHPRRPQCARCGTR